MCCLIFCSFAKAEIVLKVVGVNPSADVKQKVPVEVYLPKEVKPEHIINMDDLKLNYDEQKGVYYMHGEYEVDPKEVIEQTVILEDIWVIPEEEIAVLEKELSKITQLLRGTEMKERMSFFKESIENKLKKIVEAQKIQDVNPNGHISKYRDNLKLLEEARADLVMARSFLVQSKLLPSMSIWKAFFTIVGFLGMLGLSFYFIWQKQAKTIDASTFTSHPAQTKEEAVKPESYEAEKEKKVKVEDIESIMKEEE